MHFRRLACLALGVWLGGSVLIMLFTSQNTRLVDQLIRTPAKQAVDYMVKLQESDLRILMNYHAIEGNRWLRYDWELTQLGLGVVVLLGLFFSAGGKRYTMILCLLMLTSVVFLHWFLTPQINRLALASGFAPLDGISVTRDRLRSLQTGYSLGESITLTLGVLLAWGLLKRGRRRSHAAQADIE